MVTNFTTWLISEMNDRGWNNSELARRAGLVPSTISMVISEHKRPGPNFCNGAARALRLPPERVFRLAGLLPSHVIGNDDGRKHEIEEYWPYLQDDDRDTLAILARTLYEKRIAYNTDAK